MARYSRFKQYGCLLFFLLSLMLTGCQPDGPWYFGEVVTDCPEYESTLLFHPPDQGMNGIELQFLTGAFGQLGYLNIFCSELPEMNDDPRHAQVVVRIQGECSYYEGVRMEGGQRLLLPSEATLLLFSTLSAGNSLEISIGNYHSTIAPDNFPRLLREWKHHHRAH